MVLKALIFNVFLISSGGWLVKAHPYGYNFGNTQPLQYANTQSYTLGNTGFGGGSINLGGGRFQSSSTYDSSFDPSTFGRSFNYGTSLKNPFTSSLGQQGTITSFNHGLNNFAPRTLNTGFNSGLFNNKFTTPTRNYNFGTLNSGFDSSAFNLGAFSGASNIKSSQLKSDCVHNTGFDSGSLNLDSLKTVSNVDSGFNTGANLGSFDTKTSFDFGSLNTKPELSHTTFNSESFNLGSVNTPNLDSTVTKTSNFGNTKSFNLGSLNSQAHAAFDSTHTQFPTTNLQSLNNFKFGSVNTGFDSSVFNSGSLSSDSLIKKTNVGTANIGVLNTKAEFPSIETGSFDFGSLHHQNAYSGSTGAVNSGNTEFKNTGVSNFGSFNSGYDAGTNVDFNTGNLGLHNTGVSNFGSANSGYDAGTNVDFNTGNLGLHNTGVSNFGSANSGYDAGTNVDFNTGNLGSQYTGVSQFGSFNTGSNTGYQGATNFDFNSNSGYNSGSQHVSSHQTVPIKETFTTQNFQQGAISSVDSDYLPPFTQSQHQISQEHVTNTYNPPQPASVYGTPSQTYSTPKVTGKLTGTVGLPGRFSQKGEDPAIYPQTKLTLPKETPGSFNFGFIEKKEQTKTVEKSQSTNLTNNSSENTLGGGILDLRLGEIGGEWNSTNNNI